jgi:hypothetical protein
MSLDQPPPPSRLLVAHTALAVLAAVAAGPFALLSAWTA